MHSSEIRETFLAYFEEREHLRVPSSSLVPAPDDTSTLLTIAGMQPMKPYFQGRERPPATRLASSQRCFRTPDIEEVGNTLRHLTFFEMLGNFSFGEYFKREAIEFGWDLSLNGFGFDPDRIWATVFGGDEELGLGPDEDAIELWKQTGVPEERIVLLDRVENFWQAGETGPCGPSSEMYIDRGPEFGDETVRPGDDTERYLEYWNLVFMSMELHEDGSVTDLPTRNIDTGLGLERMAMIQQGVTSVFETDGFRPLVELAEEMSGRGYADDLKTGRAMRILADHSRGMVNLIADGVVPSNEDRGYVLRRVMRRAILQGRVLGLEAPYLGRFAETAIEHFAEVAPHLTAERDTVLRWVNDEEESFGRTLDRGSELLARLIDRAKQEGTSWVSADDAFQLHDTYGFPYEMTRELLAEEGLSVDDQGFEALMEQQRERARRGSGAAAPDTHEAVIEFAGAAPATRFVGYERLRAETSVAAARPLGDDGAVLVKLEESPFYPEGGGQVSDSGVVAWEGGEATVDDVYRLGDDQVVRVAGEAVEDRRPGGRPGRPRDPSRHDAQPHRHAPAPRGAAPAPRNPRPPGRVRRSTRQAALRLHPRAPAHARRAARHRGRRERLGQGQPSGARAGDVAPRGGGARRDGAVRREVRRLGPDGRGRRGLARALRRHPRRDHGRVRHLRDRRRGLERRERPPDRGADRPGRDRLVPPPKRRPANRRARARPARRPGLGRAARRGTTRRVRAPRRSRLGREAAGQEAEELVSAAEDVGGVKVVTARSALADQRALMDLGAQVRDRLGEAAVVLGGSGDGKVALVALLSKGVIEKGLSAQDVVREAAEIVGGGGGGRDDAAQAGGRDPSKLDPALDAARAAIVAGLGG